MNKNNFRKVPYSTFLIKKTLVTNFYSHFRIHLNCFNLWLLLDTRKLLGIQESDLFFCYNHAILLYLLPCFHALTNTDIYQMHVQVYRFTYTFNGTNLIVFANTINRFIIKGHWRISLSCWSCILSQCTAQLGVLNPPVKQAFASKARNILFQFKVS